MKSNRNQKQLSPISQYKPNYARNESERLRVKKNLSPLEKYQMESDKFVKPNNYSPHLLNKHRRGGSSGYDNSYKYPGIVSM